MYELWFRKVYLESIRNRTLTAAVRPEDRRWPHSKAVRPSQVALVRIIDVPGSEVDGIPPSFMNYKYFFVLKDVVVKKIGELTYEDLIGCSEDSRSPEQVKDHLFSIYNTKFYDSDVVTVLHWEYLGDVNMVKDLIVRGLIQVGMNATGNPPGLPQFKFAMGIANKDYPAKTPFLWNRAYQDFGLNTRNVRAFGKPEKAQEIFDAFRDDPYYIGGDVGVGFKDQVLEYLDDIDPLAKMMGAINVVVKVNGGLKGYNTDGVGYADSLEEALRLQNKSLSECTVMLLGAGGTTNAIAFALASCGAKLIILNRTSSKAVSLAERINGYFDQSLAIGGSREEISSALSGVAAVVSIIDDPDSPLDKYNALGSIELPVSELSLAANLADAKSVLSGAPKDLIISDVMLRSQDTATIALAKEMGFPTLDGVPMVVNQAIEAFWLVNQTELTAKGITKAQVAESIRS